MLFLNQRAETGVLVAMNSHKTTTVAVNSQLLKPYRQATKILGIPVGQLVEEFLNPFKGEPEQIGEEFRWISYPMHECALAAAERFEAFAIEEKPKSNPDIGMVATRSSRARGTLGGKARLSVHVGRKHLENNCVRPVGGGGGLIRVTSIPGIRRIGGKNKEPCSEAPLLPTH